MGIGSGQVILGNSDWKYPSPNLVGGVGLKKSVTHLVNSIPNI